MNKTIKQSPLILSKNRRSLDEPLNGIIGLDTHINGLLKGEQNLYIRGHIYGDLDLQGTVYIAPEGLVKGNIIADIIIIEGTVEGNITARKKVNIRSSANIIGNIQSPFIVATKDAKWEGEILKINDRTIIVRRYREKRTIKVKKSKNRKSKSL